MKPGNNMGDAQKKMGNSFQKAMSEMAMAMEAIQLIQLQVENSVQGFEALPEPSFPNMELSQYETLRNVAEAEAMLEYLDQHPELKQGRPLPNSAPDRVSGAQSTVFKDGFITEMESSRGEPLPRPNPGLGAGLAARVNQPREPQGSGPQADPFHALEAQSKDFDLHLQRLADEMERYK